MKIKQKAVSLKRKHVLKRPIFLMKLSLTMFLVCCLQLMAASSFSQNKISLKLDNASLQSILNQIENQTDYSFVFNNDDIDIKQKFSINILEKDIVSTMNTLFKTTDITYKFRKKLIVLSHQKRSNKTHTIHGTVRDAATGETLIGANIIVVNKNKGAITNTYGFYSLTLPEGNYTLQISYLGYALKEIVITLKTNLNKDFELQPVLNALGEVVVTSTVKNKSQVRNVLSGVNNLTATDIKNLPSFFGEPDITRAVLTQPGVSSVGEGTAGFNIRGGNIDQNLVLLDEAPMYISSHLWGLFSVVNADAIKGMTLYKGGIPARYGGRASFQCWIFAKRKVTLKNLKAKAA